jgi:hypothetical protein
MVWQVCIRFPNGQEKAICSYKNREAALKRIDAIYSQGYPMHVAYVVRPAEALDQFPNHGLGLCWQFS